MNFYKQKKQFMGEIQAFLGNNLGKKVPLYVLEAKFWLKYGFSKTIILRALRIYEKMGMITIKDDMIEVLEPKIPKTKKKKKGV